MTLNRMPLFVWAMLVTAFMIMFAMPAVMLSSTALIMDRLVGTHFFNAAEGGDPLLWQHLFWFFGHPEVYFIFMPGLGFVSSIIGTFARRPIFGYVAMVLSLVATAFFAFGLWVHHMFATDLPELGKSFFTAASMVIAIPTAVQIFCWIATLWNGQLSFRDAAAVRPRLLLHLHHRRPHRRDAGVRAARSAGARHLLRRRAFALRADRRRGLSRCSARSTTGFPKFTGRMLDERLGQWNFWLFFVGFNVAFFPMHILGLRRHAAARLHLSCGDGLGAAESPVDDRRADHRGERRAVHDQRRHQLPQRRARGRQSVGRQHARVGDDIAAAVVQLRAHSRRSRP